MDLELKNKVAVVTGAGAGIGRSVAIALAGEGCNVALGSRSQEPLNDVRRLCEATGVSVVTVAGDMASDSSCRELMETAIRELGGIDSVVTCVGSTPIGDFDQLSDQNWQLALDTKFLASVRAVRAALPELRRRGGGRIVMVAGNAAQHPTPLMTTSGAINAALCNLTASLAQHLAPSGIGINAICPGPTETRRYSGLKKATAEYRRISEEDASAKIIAGIADGRVASPDEVAALIAYLCSPKSSHITGSISIIDGGQS